MTSGPEFRLTHTHIYPGATGRVIAFDDATQRQPCIVELADGVIVPAAYELIAPGRVVLDVPAHRTAKGTSIPPKSWKLSVDPSSGDFRVLAHSVSSDL